MPRPRNTFSDGKGGIRKKRFPVFAHWVGDEAKPSDRDLDPGLAAIVQRERAWRYLIELMPSQQDVRYTLNALAKLDDEKLPLAVRKIDDVTRVRLVTGAYLYWKQHFGAIEVIPDWLDIEDHAPILIRKFIEIAIPTIPAKVGRPKTFNRDVEFALVLARYWQGKHHKKPSVVKWGDKETPFMKWAADIFTRAGISKPSSSHSHIYDIFRNAINSL
ncbi:hypothetical protein [Methylomonas sp. DH-1]|uniref:hypothetical protein n=1 Tax=Methylomonas sp. (strain DH-1) TaxID=1727196 RepID=UPI0012F692C1|nr:hypothetical protein [Methylomonas sp. DH-1]